MWFQDFFDTVGLVCTNSGSFCRCYWLRKVLNGPRKLLQLVWCLESPYNLDFRIGFFWEILQVCNEVLSAASSPLAIRSCSDTCKEAIRSTISTKISCNYDFIYLILKNLFSYLFMCNLVQIWSKLIKTCHNPLSTKYWHDNVHKKIF